jgi:hypothetical protein
VGAEMGDCRINLDKHHAELMMGNYVAQKTIFLFAWWGFYTM